MQEKEVNNHENKLHGIIFELYNFKCSLYMFSTLKCLYLKIKNRKFILGFRPDKKVSVTSILDQPL